MTIVELDPVLVNQALTGNSGLLEDMIGFEPITRAVRLVLAKGVNSWIDRQSERWKIKDLALQALGIEQLGQIEVEHIPLDHIHEGPHPSFLESPPEAFPNITVMGYITRPSGSQFDQFDSSEITLFVETMCLAGPVPAGQDTVYETIVHRRIERTTEAVHATLRSDPMLLGTVDPMRLPPIGGIGTASWLRRQEGGSSLRHLMHGSRLQYTLQRHAAF